MFLSRFLAVARTATTRATSNAPRYASFPSAARFQPFSRSFAQRPSIQIPRGAFQRAGPVRNYRQAFNYQRYQTSRGYFQRWAARPTFCYEVAGLGALCGGYYIANLETVPISGRKRFNVISYESEAQAGQSQLQEVLQQYQHQLLPRSSREHRMVRRVLDRLVPQSGLENEEWEVYVIDEAVFNAFVLPGGKVFVFRGLLDVCNDDPHLAAVLSHEIAHNVAHHAAERMSLAYALVPLAILGFLVGGVDPYITNSITSLLLSLPGSRKQESEADFIGLLMMAESCYDPRAALDIWERLERLQHDSVPQFLRTHPSNPTRWKSIQGWLPQAEEKMNEAGCGATTRFADGFRQVTGFPLTNP